MVSDEVDGEAGDAEECGGLWGEGDAASTGRGSEDDGMASAPLEFDVVAECG